jgi:hypothetical protein
VQSTPIWSAWFSGVAVDIFSQVVEKESATLGWPKELDIASSSHHSNICKFPSPSDARYKTAVHALAELAKDLDDGDDTSKWPFPMFPEMEATVFPMLIEIFSLRLHIAGRSLHARPKLRL